MQTIDEWLDRVSGDDFVWFVKRLSANDTGATKSNQVGVYFPKNAIRVLFPNVAESVTVPNPKHNFRTHYDSIGGQHTADTVVTWYNNSLFDPKRTRNEFRVTKWGGGKRGISPVQNKEATGAITIFAFQGAPNPKTCRVWVCSTLDEEEAVEDRLGPVDPGVARIIYPTHPAGTNGLEIVEGADPCQLKEDELPPEWREEFPTGEAIIDMAISLSQRHEAGPPDHRLMRRRDCEYSIFRSVERHLVMPRIKQGFGTVDEFVAFAGTVANRRKSRSGRSLELHVEKILTDMQLPHIRGATVEGGKRPDFLFPSLEAYNNPKFPDEKLRMLAAKTTCKERWNQILNEASRIENKHLLTLQDGVSVGEFEKMDRAKVTLVVPSELHGRYPAKIRHKLMSLDAFIAETRALCA